MFIIISVKCFELKKDWEKNGGWLLDVIECICFVDLIRWYLKVLRIVEKIYIISSDIRYWFKRYVVLFLCLWFLWWMVCIFVVILCCMCFDVCGFIG